MALVLQNVPRPPTSAPSAILVVFCTLVYAIVYLGTTDLVMNLEVEVISILKALSTIWYLHVVLALVSTLVCSTIIHYINGARFTRFQGVLLPLPMFAVFAIADYPYTESKYVPVMLLAVFIVSSTSSITAALAYRR